MGDERESCAVEGRVSHAPSRSVTLVTQWEQLDKHPKASWLRLPAWVRGYGDEILRHCNTDGLVIDTDDPADIALVIRAHPDEVTRLGEAVEKLVSQGFLSRTEAGLFVTNYKTMRQRRLATERKKKQRNQDDPDEAVTDSHTPSRSVTLRHGGHAQDVSSHRGEERRGEDSPPNPPPGGRSGAQRFEDSFRGRRPDHLTADGPECRQAISSLGLTPEVVALRLEDHRVWCADKGATATNWDANLAGFLRRTTARDHERAKAARRAPGTKRKRAHVTIQQLKDEDR